MTDFDFWPTAEQVCTPKELEVLKYMAGGLGYRRIARKLGISPEAVRGRYERAERKIKAAKEAA